MPRSASFVATFFVANPGHHTAMVQPVVRTLAAAGRRCRVLSLCEFRGFSTPKEAFALDRVEVTPLVPFRFRRKPGGASIAAGGSRTARKTIRGGLRKLAWAALRTRIDRCVGPDTGVAILPNDAAYPYRGIADLLRERGVPFVLLQEGVRFSVPGIGDSDAYGQGGANAIAAWGASSAEYFRSQGVAAPAIHLTGSPRFDSFDRTQWIERGRALRADLGLEHRKVLLYLSNPIELLGLTRSTSEKIELFRRFCDAARHVIERERAQVLVKLHASEPATEFQRALDGWAPDAIRIVEDVPLYSLLGAANAAVILASTVGMEALLFDLPLGVLELPRVGYAFDYVQRGAALGLGSSPDQMHTNVARLLTGGGPSQQARERYLEQMIAVRTGATDRVAELVERCARV